MLIPLEKILYSTLYLLPAAIVSGLSIALQALGKIRGKEEIQDPTRFPLFKLFAWRYPKRIWESILFTLYISKLVYYLIFGFVSFYFSFCTKLADPIPLKQQTNFVLRLFHTRDLFNRRNFPTLRISPVSSDRKSSRNCRTISFPTSFVAHGPLPSFDVFIF